jgi:hypothetical protein
MTPSVIEPATFRLVAVPQRRTPCERDPVDKINGAARSNTPVSAVAIHRRTKKYVQCANYVVLRILLVVRNLTLTKIHLNYINCTKFTFM